MDVEPLNLMAGEKVTRNRKEASYHQKGIILGFIGLSGT